MTDNIQELGEQLANWFDNMGSENPFWSRAHSTKMGELIMPIITTYTEKQIEAELEALREEVKHENLRTISQIITARIDKLNHKRT